jgi:hypothetical protein
MIPKPHPGTYSVCGFAADGARRTYFVCPVCWTEWIEEISEYVPNGVPYEKRCPGEDCGQEAAYEYSLWLSGDPDECLASFERPYSERPDPDTSVSGEQASSNQPCSLDVEIAAFLRGDIGPNTEEPELLGDSEQGGELVTEQCVDEAVDTLETAERDLWLSAVRRSYLGPFESH